jgi:transposase
MLLHGNAKLTPFQRALLCDRVREECWTVGEAAEAAGCSERTAYRWLARHDAGEAMTDRSSAPHHRPTRTPPRTEARIERLRRLRWTSTRIAATLEMAVSTVCAVLARLGLNRLWKLGPPEPPNRYCRRHAGELVHVDVKKLGRFTRPGKRVLGEGPGRRSPRAGWEAVHVCIDDATRLAYIEVLPDEKALTTVGFFERAGRMVRGPGCARPPGAVRQWRALQVRPLGDVVLDASHRASPHPSLPATHQRKGRTIHPDHAARVGLRRDLSHLSAPSSCTSRMDRLLQPPTTPGALGHKTPASRLHAD